MKTAINVSKMNTFLKESSNLDFFSNEKKPIRVRQVHLKAVSPIQTLHVPYFHYFESGCLKVVIDFSAPAVCGAPMSHYLSFFVEFVFEPTVARTGNRP